MTYENILYGVDDRLATITLNRPERRNALTWALLAELSDALRRAEKDNDVRVIVLKAAGPAFCSGHDMNDTGSDAPRHLDSRSWNEIGRTGGQDGGGISVWDNRARVQGHIEADLEIWNCWKPVVAQVQGYCLGGGVGLALSCDLLVASEDARMGYPPVRAMAPGEEISLFSWHIGLKRAKWLSLTGDSLTAKEMLDFGAANFVVAPDRLDEETRKIARRIANIDSELLNLSKTLVNRIFDQQGYSHSMKQSGEFVGLAQQLRSMQSFKRTIREKGLKTALDERDAPFGGIVGRYPPVEE
jgi:enoyl-CoA hydratase